MLIRVQNDRQCPLETFLNERIYVQNSNAVILFDGKVGTGKTYSAISLAEQYDPKFDASCICFNIRELISKILEIQKTNEKGRVLIYEEVQYQQNKNRGMTHEAVSFTQILSTFRFLNLVVIFTSPYLEQLHGDIRNFIDLELKTMYIDRSRGLCYLNLIYRENGESLRLQVLNLENINFVCHKQLIISKPSSEMIESYERRKREFLPMMLEIIDRQINKKEEKLIGKETKPNIWICSQCGYEWNARVEHPKQCAHCTNDNIKKKA